MSEKGASHGKKREKRTSNTPTTNYRDTTETAEQIVYPFPHVFAVQKAMTPEDREIYQWVQQRFDTFINDNNKQIAVYDASSNAAQRDLSLALNTFTSILITGTVIFLGQKDILNMLSWRQDLLVLLILGALFASVWFSYRDMLATKKFFTDWSSGYGSMGKSLEEEGIDDMPNLASLYSFRAKYFMERKLIKNDSGETIFSDEKWFKLQLRCLIIAGAGYILFSWITFV
jgi:hypothetical protein